MKNTVQYIFNTLIKNKTSFHTYEGIPMNVAEQKINYPSIYIIQCTLYCFVTVSPCSRYQQGTHFSRFSRVSSLSVWRWSSSTVHPSDSRAFPGLRYVSETHANISGGIEFLGLSVGKPQRCVCRNARTQSTTLKGRTRCHVAVKAQINDLMTCLTFPSHQRIYLFIQSELEM